MTHPGVPYTVDGAPELCLSGTELPAGGGEAGGRSVGRRRAECRICTPAVLEVGDERPCGRAERRAQTVRSGQMLSRETVQRGGLSPGCASASEGRAAVHPGTVERRDHGGKYLAALTGSADGTTTPSVDGVTIAYNTDDPPTVTIGGVTVTGTTARVTFSSTATDVARCECRLNSGAFTTCTSPRDFTGLALGSHTVAVRAVDQVGNIGPAVTHGFTIAKPPIVVDATPPNVRVTVRFLRATRKGLVKVRVYWPATETRCRVTVRIKRGDRVVAQRTLTIKGGKKRTFVLKLSKPTLRALVFKGRLKATLRVTARDAAHNTKRISKRITLLRPKHL